MNQKNEQIKVTMAQTKLKRQTQVCRVIELKVDESHLNREQHESLKMMFVEGKWCWNHLLNQPDVFKYDYKLLTRVQAKDKDGNMVEHDITHLSAKNRQNILYQVQHAIKALSALKTKAKRKVGKLKFKSEYGCIELSQYGITHKITGQRTVKINGIKRHIKVRGLDQITPAMEFANAKLIRKASGYYLFLTTYQTRSMVGFNNLPKPNVGLDFGISKNITTSDGQFYHVSVPEDKHLRRLQQKLQRSQKGSKNRYRLQWKIRKCHERLGNQKKDMANKIIHELLTKYNRIYFQDESLKGWHSGWFGRQVQHSCMGTVKRKLKEKTGRTWMIDKFFPSTKFCYQCGAMNEIPLEQRVYTCACGLSEHRDIKSAKTILYVGLQKENHLFVPTGRRDIKPVESTTSVIGSDSDGKSCSTKQEAPHFNGE